MMGSPKCGGSLRAFTYPGRLARAVIKPLGMQDLTLTTRREQIENKLHPTREVELYTCGRRPPSSLCALRSGKSKASTGAQHRRYPSVSPRWTLGFPAGRYRSKAQPPRFLQQGSLLARAARCSGVSRDWT